MKNTTIHHSPKNLKPMAAQEAALKPVSAQPFCRKTSYPFWKRTMDVFCASVGLLLLSPVFLLAAAAIFVEDGRPFFYRQKRVGQGEKIFYMYKFRSMRKDADQIHEQLRAQHQNTEVSFKLKDEEDPRITKVGLFLRKSCIDELPQLINILLGHLSLCGPRPLPVYEYEEERKRYGMKYAERYIVPQGLTCYWQLSSRSEPDFSDRMQMDVDYAREANLWIDFKLTLKTAWAMVSGKAGY